MTTEIERKFFEAFGIKPKLDGSDFDKSIQSTYPEITDRILLELVCLTTEFYLFVPHTANIEVLKSEILDSLITIQVWSAYVEDAKFKGLYNKVRTLFGLKGKI